MGLLCRSVICTFAVGMITPNAERNGLINHDFLWMVNCLTMTTLAALLSRGSSWHWVSDRKDGAVPLSQDNL